MGHNTRKYQIAVDGPAGSGKSTIAKLIAVRLGFLYIDSGAMYRAVTLYFLKKKLLNKPERILNKEIKKIKIDFKEKGQRKSVFLNNVDVTSEIRSSKVNKLVSEVSSKNFVRKEMVKRQREFALNNSVVMDGRDIGTTVFPNADLKIYLTASPFVRAKRRRNDLLKIKEKISIQKLVQEIQARDNYDSSRDISPLSKAQDSIVIDSSSLSISEVLEKINIFLPII